MHKSEIKFGILLMLLLAAAGLGVRNRSKLEWKELVPIFNKNNLTACGQWLAENEFTPSQLTPLYPPTWNHPSA